jgi:hypothetical protein
MRSLRPPKASIPALGATFHLQPSTLTLNSDGIVQAAKDKRPDRGNNFQPSTVASHLV